MDKKLHYKEILKPQQNLDNKVSLLHKLVIYDFHQVAFDSLCFALLEERYIGGYKSTFKYSLFSNNQNTLSKCILKKHLHILVLLPYPTTLPFP